MDTAEIFVLVGGTLLIALTLWFFFGQRADEAALAGDEGKPLYQCPMHAWISSTDPTAICSICGMKLVRRGDAGAKEAVNHEHSPR